MLLVHAKPSHRRDQEDRGRTDGRIRGSNNNMSPEDPLDPKTTTLTETEFYDLICEIVERDARDGYNTVEWGCQLMSEYREARR